ncbi:MAG: PAS domain S-box protein [Methanoregulaceae archaeon]|jgi:PAS domain S-box-containing protein
MILDQEKIGRIKNALKFSKKGMSISEITRQLKMNRNSVAKYLEILLISGQVEIKIYGTSKVYTLSQRMPLSAMMDFSSDIIVMVDSNQRIIQVNEQLLQFTGMPREELIGQTADQTGLKFLIGLPLDAVFKAEKDYKTESLERKLLQNEHEIYLSYKLIPTIFDDGNEGITILIEDITSRKTAERSLVESEKMYRTVIDNMQDCFYRSDHNGNLIMASPSWAPLLRYGSVDNFYGKNIAEKFYMEPEKRKELLEVLSKTGSVSNYEVVLKHKDGTPIHVSINSHFYYDESGNVLGVEGIARDITEQRVAEKKVQEHILRMEFFSQKLQEFIELPISTDIYEKIASDLKFLIPCSMIGVNSYNNETGILSCRSFVGDDDRATWIRCVGQDPRTIEYPVDSMFIRSICTGRFQKIPFSLYDIVSSVIPKETCEQLEAAINIGDVYAIGFVWGDMVFGNATIFCHKGATIPDIQLVETYVRAASISLQRHIAENSLKKSEEIFSNVAENSPLPMAIIDPNGTYRYINRNFIQAFGYDLKDFRTGREWFLLAFPDPEYRKNVIATWVSDLQSSDIGKVRGRLFSVRCKDGMKKEVYFRPVTLSDGEQCIVYEDVTVHIQAQQTRKLLSSIIESTDDAIIGKNPEGVIISWNRAAERLYGYTQEEMIGRHISLIIPPKQRPEMEEILKRIKNRESVNNLETVRVRKDGNVIEVAVTVSPIIDEDGTVIGASTIGRDISFKKAEKQLEESEGNYRELVDNIVIGVYRSTGDPRGRFIWANSSLVRILGYQSIDALKSVDVAELFIEQDGRKRFLEELQKTGFVKNKETLLKRPDGKTICVMVTAFAIYNQKGGIARIKGIVEDISDHRDAQSQLQVMRKEILDIVEFIPDPTFVIDSNKNVVAWNTAIEQLTGVKREEILNKGGYAYAFPFYGESRPILIDLIDAPDGEVAKYYSDVRRNGSTLEAEVFAPAVKEWKGAYLWGKASPFFDPAGNRLGAIETIRDISDSRHFKGQATTEGERESGTQKRPFSVPSLTSGARAHAGKSPELLSLIYLSNALRNAAEGITILDLSARCIWTNDALVSMFGAESSDAVVGKSVAHYIASEHRKTTLDRLLEVRKHGHASFPLFLMSPHGRVPVEASVSLVSDDSGKLLGYMAIMRQR